MNIGEVVDLKTLRESNPNLWREKRDQLIGKIPDIDERDDINLEELKKLKISIKDLWMFQRDFLPDEISINKSIIDEFVNSIQSRDAVLKRNDTLMHDLFLSSYELLKQKGESKESLDKVISEQRETIAELTKTCSVLELIILEVRTDIVQTIINEIMTRKSFFASRRDFEKDEVSIKTFDEIIKQLDSLFEFLMYRTLGDPITLPIMEKIQMAVYDKE